MPENQLILPGFESAMQTATNDIEDARAKRLKVAQQAAEEIAQRYPEQETAVRQHENGSISITVRNKA